MRVSKQKMPPGGSSSDKPSMRVIRDAITAPRKQIEVPVMSAHTMERRVAVVTVPRAPWDRDQ
jgi:phosphoribosylcarboxyaminoimidazole (NCAIR) mutase